MRIAVSLTLLLTGLPCFAAESDALAISANIQARHFPYGTVIDRSSHLRRATRLPATPVAATRRCGPGTIWRGGFSLQGDSVLQTRGECTEGYRGLSRW